MNNDFVATAQRRQQRTQILLSSRVSNSFFVRAGEVIQRYCCEMFNSEYTMSSTVRPGTRCSPIYILEHILTMLIPSLIILVPIHLDSQITKPHTKSSDRLPNFRFPSQLILQLTSQQLGCLANVTRLPHFHPPIPPHRSARKPKTQAATNAVAARATAQEITSNATTRSAN